MSRNRIISVGFAAYIAVFVVGAVAWACTPSAYLYPVSPSSGAAGSEATLRGGQFGMGSVEIRWGSENGKLLAKALGPDFAAKVVIPDKAEGVYYLVAVARDPADPSRILARRAEAFQITTNPRSEARNAASLWGEAEPYPDEGRLPSAAVAAVGLGLAAAGAVLGALVVVRRRKAEI